MKLPFIKLEGLGNCYIFAEAQKVSKINHRKLAIAISRISTGIGADGLIIVDTRKEPHRMTIFNRDGSEAELCGNGLRQAALFIRKCNKSNKKKFILKTITGKFQAEIKSIKGNKANVRTSLGSPDFSAEAIGLKASKGLAFDIDLVIGKRKKYPADCVSFGNPHAVIWVNNFDFDWETTGASLSKHPMFSDGTNVHFCRVVNSRRFQMMIYERGSGVTMACGSGAAACFAAGVMKSKLGRNVVAEMPGGNLKLTWDMSESLIYQEGPVSIVCVGEYFI